MDGCMRWLTVMLCFSEGGYHKSHHTDGWGGVVESYIKGRSHLYSYKYSIVGIKPTST